MSDWAILSLLSAVISIPCRAGQPTSLWQSALSDDVPPLAKVDFKQLPNVFSNVKNSIYFVNPDWIIGPVLMFLLAILFLHDYPDFMAGVILIGLARCIAMVLVWNELSEGNTEYGAGLVGPEQYLSGFFYSFYAWIFITKLPPLFGFEEAIVDISMGTIAQTVCRLSGHSFPDGYP